MGSGYLTNPLVFVIYTIFSLYILAVMLRFLLQLCRANFRNPVAEALVKITNPPLKPLRRFIPGVGGVDVASVVLLLLLQIAAIAVIGVIKGSSLNPIVVLLSAAFELIGLVISIYLYGILIQVVLSWVAPNNYNPVLGMLNSLTEPILGPARRLIPPLGGLDLSPLVAMVGLQVIKMLIDPLLPKLIAIALQ